MTRQKRSVTAGLTQKANGVWERTETIGGKRRSFSSLNPAEVWRKIDAAKIDAARVAEDAQATRDFGPRFQDVAERYRDTVVAKMKNGTQKSYKPAIARAIACLGDYRMREIEPWQIATWLRTPPVGSFKATTVTNHKTVINNIYQFWIDDPTWRGDVNPAQLTHVPRGLERNKRLPPSDAQVEMVKNSVGDQDALLPIAYLCTGERRGEMCAIRLQDIDFKKRLIHIDRAVEHVNNQPHIITTKTNAGVRTIPLLDLLYKALQPLRKLPKGTYIIGLKDKPITASGYRRLWEKFWRKQGVATEVKRVKKVMHHGKREDVKYTDYKVPVCGHQFRHEYVCMLCQAEVPEDVAIQLVGHANAHMIHEVYMALKPKMITDAAAKLNAFLSDKQTNKCTRPTTPRPCALPPSVRK